MVIKPCIFLSRIIIEYVAQSTLTPYTMQASLQSKAIEALPAALAYFEALWGAKYPLVVQSWRNNWPEIATFFKYPPELRKIIYTTNMIESYHRQLRKITKGKSVFSNDEALMKMLYLITQDVMLRWTGRIHNWGQKLLQLSVFFPEKEKSRLR